MIIMGIESSSSTASIGISKGEILLGEYTINSKNTHSEKLMPMIENIVDNLNLKMNEIDLFAISKGPGSFTGLRIGMSTAKAFAYSLEKSIVGISSLEVMANGLRLSEGKIIVPMIDARNKRVFSGIYRIEKEKTINLVKEEAYELEELLNILRQYDEKVIFIGDGSISYREEIIEGIESSIFTPNHLNVPKGGSLCELGLKYFREKKIDNYFTISPNYLRKSQAQRQREESK